jgi:hypothetical protein
MEFQKVFSRLCNTKSAWQAWSDFVEMTAIAISNRFEVRMDVKQQREQRYLDIIGQYGKDEQALFPELVGILVMSLEREPEQDFLGEMFMALELGSHWKGQFFTAKKEIGRLGNDLEQVRASLNGYIILNNQKEKYILELEQAIQYRNTLKGLLRGLAGWMIRKAKSCAKKLLRRNANG